MFTHLKMNNLSFLFFFRSITHKSVDNTCKDIKFCADIK